MKKIALCFVCIIAVLFISGCSMDNTPTKKVESFLDNYKNHDETVLSQLKEMVDSDSLMDETQRGTYSDIMKRQYKDMTYEIKDEVIDGDKATVTAEIEVYDYYKINQDANDYYSSNPDEFKNDKSDGLVGDIAEGAKDVVEGAKDAVKGAAEGVKDAAKDVTGDSKYVEYRLGKLGEAKDRVKYTIDFTLTKRDDVWVLDDIDDATRQKIHGLYAH